MIGLTIESVVVRDGIIEVIYIGDQSPSIILKPKRNFKVDRVEVDNSPTQRLHSKRSSFTKIPHGYIRQSVINHMMARYPSCVSGDELAESLGVKNKQISDTVWRLCKEGMLRRVRLGVYVYNKPNDINEEVV